MKISIVIPVYKVEQYLRRCLDSVIKQTYTNYECILVNDGSPDNCPAICDEYVKMDKRFAVIHKNKNEGLPKARKSGLDIAIGEFVFHLDSDDWIEADALEVLFKRQEETNADIVIGNFRAIYSGSIKKRFYIPIKREENVIEWFLLCKYKYLWGKLYRRFLFDDYIVPETNMLEDGIVNIQLLLKLTIDRIQFIDEVIYNYDRTVINSIIAQERKNKFNSHEEYPMIVAYFWINDYLKHSMHDYSSKTYSSLIYSMLQDGIFGYLEQNINISKYEIKCLYNNYYKKCFHLNLIRKPKRIILPLYMFSVNVGKMYMFIFTTLLHLCKY